VIHNPGVCVPKEDATGQPLWSIDDPVHPVYEGYNLIGDMLCEEILKLTKKSPSGNWVEGHLKSGQEKASR
jgi:hypothetical protein